MFSIVDDHDIDSVFTEYRSANAQAWQLLQSQAPILDAKGLMKRDDSFGILVGVLVGQADGLLGIVGVQRRNGYWKHKTNYGG